MPTPPFWLTAETLRLEIGGTQLGSLAGQIQEATDGLAKPMREDALRAKLAFDLLKEWSDEQLAAKTEPTAQLAESLAAFLDDTWTTGVHLFLPLPDYGGFEYLRRALGEALIREDDESRPLFGEGVYAGGVLLVISGGKIPVFTALAAFAALFGGNAPAILNSMGQALSETPALADLWATASDLANLPAQEWSTTTQAFGQWYEGSAIKRLTNGEFLGDLLGAEPPSPIEPPEVEAGKIVNVTLRGDFPEGMLLRAGTAILAPSRQSRKEIEVTLPGRLLTAGELPLVGLETDFEGGVSREIYIGALRVRATDPFGAMGTFSEDAIFDRWRALSVGSAVNGLLPGAQHVVRQTVEGLAGIGKASDEVRDAFQMGFSRAGTAISATLDQTAKTTESLGAAAGALVDDALKVGGAVLVILPEKGGVHQLGFALSEGLSEYASNAPVLNEETIVAGLFVCAGATTADEVNKSLKRFGAAMGIAPLANL